MVPFGKWPETLLGLLIVSLDAPKYTGNRGSSGLVAGAAWSPGRKVDVREKTRDLWYHGYNNYMTHAFPLDELTPLSCTGRGPDWHNPANISVNDVAGNFSLTLIDVLDSLVVLGDRPAFETAVRNTIKWVSFDVNTKPQVFETTIRVLGGLLSGHQFASKEGQQFHLPWYKGELLDMAKDLGERLLPAFATPTGMPYARSNLRHGVMRGETVETCTAGAGSLIIEFATLSRLTGDDRFEKAAYKAYFAVWNRRSDLGLVGNTINTYTGKWNHPEITGIGAGIDSFFEYALKWYVLSGESEFLDVWLEAYPALMRYARSPDGFTYRSANIYTGDAAYFTTDSLSAFWPGLQVLAGDIQNAIKSHLVYWNIWKRYSGLPEVFDLNFAVGTSFQYPLRPEFIESTWYLYRATKDPFYLDVGERVLNDIISRAKVECGLTGIQDLRTNQRDDRMESFVLSETLKYLYLLFDEENLVNADDSNFIFTTEGHILTLDKAHIRPVSSIRRKLRGSESHQCPAYLPPLLASRGRNQDEGIVGGIRARADLDYPRKVIGTLPTESDKQHWSSEGWCELPALQLYSYDFVLASNGQFVPEEARPYRQLTVVADGFVVQNVTGIRTRIVTRMDGKGYDVTKLGPHSVRSGQIVYINDTELQLGPVTPTATVEKHGQRRPTDVQLHFFADFVDPMLENQPSMHDLLSEDIVFTGFTAMFGGDPTTAPTGSEAHMLFGHGEGVPVARDEGNRFGCEPYTHPFEDDAILVSRGGCTFLEKLIHAMSAGASGVVVVSDSDTGLNPSASKEEIESAGEALNDVALVVLKQIDGRLLESMMDAADGVGGRVWLAVEPEGPTSDPAPEGETRRSKGAASDPPRLLYLNGHALLNTRLLV